MLGPLVQAGSAALSYFGAREANKQNAAQAAQQMQMQKEFAQNGIRWRVDDAKRSGIHPLFALGAQTHSYTPQSASFSNEFSGAASHLASMGQDISRAQQAGSTNSERNLAFDNTMRNFQLKNAELDLGIKQATLASAIQRLKQNSQPPIPEGSAPFAVPEANKSEDRPPLMFGGTRIMTPPDTSPMKAFEDQFGDDGPLAWLLSAAVGARTAYYNASERLKRDVKVKPAPFSWWPKVERR